jgi:radical SAM superfamily enzyme YgiQ (UPF0313 family)
MDVALVNTNRIKPPIAPIGLDYVAEAVHAAGHHVRVLDLCWAEDVPSAIASFFAGASDSLVGITLRNTDDCAFTSRQSFVAPFVDMVGQVRRCSGAPIVVGGVGFSVMPELILAHLDEMLPGSVDAAVWGEGEWAFPRLVARLERDGGVRPSAKGSTKPTAQRVSAWHDIPNLIWRRQRDDGSVHWQRNPPAFGSLAALPPMSRRWVDNVRYFQEGGQAGIETKRGCPGRCIYCADPLAKGSRTRTRPLQDVVDELERLLEQGIDHIHTCDSEFNLPEWHAFDVCQEILRRGLGHKLRWYAYCTPASFSQELALAMRDAGCVGINFGADHGDAEMLHRLGRSYRPEDIVRATRWCREAGMAVMLDLLLGSPGETRESLIRTIELVDRAAPDRVGISMGIRVYPGTTLARQLASRNGRLGLVGGADPSTPLFFLEPTIAPFCASLLDERIGDDPRFFFFDPSRPDKNYNYNANERLSNAIAAGYRGAYWDILRRLAE